MHVDEEHCQIILQRGIEAGFAPPTPTARRVITIDNDVLNISTELRSPGTSKLLPPTKTQLKLADYAQAMADLLALLRNLPAQYPGGVDMYGRNIGIWATERSEPVNFHESRLIVTLNMPQGPGPTEEQKELFDDAVEIIESLPSTEETA